jgi:hypothetical protein
MPHQSILPAAGAFGGSAGRTIERSHGHDFRSKTDLICCPEISINRTVLFDPGRKAKKIKGRFYIRIAKSAVLKNPTFRSRGKCVWISAPPVAQWPNNAWRRMISANATMIRNCNRGIENNHRGINGLGFAIGRTT